MLSRLFSVLILLPLLCTAVAGQAAPPRDRLARNGEAADRPQTGRVPVIRAPSNGRPVPAAMVGEDQPEPAVGLFYPAPGGGGREDAAAAPPKKPRRTCIRTNQIRNADVLDDSTIRLTLGKNRKVDMKLRGTCFGLAFDESFYYQPGPGMELCERFDTIVARSGSRCLIDAFVPVEPPVKK